MSKIALITDLHFGIKNGDVRFIEYYKKFYNTQFFPYLKENDIKSVIILGDLFDNRKSTQTNILKFIKDDLFDKLAELNIKTYIIIGNHDTYYRNTNAINTVDIIVSGYTNIVVIDEPKDLLVEETNICFIPWIANDNVEECLKQLANSNSKICMGHFEIAGFAMYFGRESKDGLNAELFNKYKVVFSGHYHQKSNKGNIHYLGAPYELTWEDYSHNRGFHIFDLDTLNLEFINNKYTMFKKLIYEDEYIGILEDIDIKDKFVKLYVKSRTDNSKFNSFLSYINGLGAHEVVSIFENVLYNKDDLKNNISGNSLLTTKEYIKLHIDNLDIKINREVINEVLDTVLL